MEKRLLISINFVIKLLDLTFLIRKLSVNIIDLSLNTRTAGFTATDFKPSASGSRYAVGYRKTNLDFGKKNGAGSHNSGRYIQAIARVAAH